MSSSDIIDGDDECEFKWKKKERILARSLDERIVSLVVETHSFRRKCISKFAAVIALVEPPEESTNTNTTQVRSVGKAEVEELGVDTSETNEIE